MLKWLKGIASKAETKWLKKIRVSIEQKLCKHWWKKTTEWEWNADFTEHKIKSRTAVCIHCDKVIEEVPEWRNFPVTNGTAKDHAKVAKKAAVK